MHSGVGDLHGGVVSWWRKEISMTNPSGSRSLVSGLDLNLAAMAAGRWRKSKVKGCVNPNSSRG
jgi:hypothetical protein